MIKPDFFLVGAPKCGTTALHTYLGEHAHIFVSEPKEPHFFDTDFGYHIIDTSAEYQALFEPAQGGGYLAIGEASATYLLSTVAIEKIKAYNPQARLIAMLRNPVQMVQAFHAERLRSGFEMEQDFERAWRLQAARRNGQHIPPTCRVPELLQYRYVGALGDHVGRLLDVFPREQVMLILFDDFARDTRRVYNDVLAFLGVPPDGREHFPRVRSNKAIRNFALHQRLVVNPPGWLRAIRRRIGFREFNFRQFIFGLNTRRAQRPPISRQFQDELIGEFSAQIDRLADLLGRDLGQWKALGRAIEQPGEGLEQSESPRRTASGQRQGG